MHAASRSVLLATLALCALLPAQTGWDGAESTAHFTVRFRQGSRAEAAVDRVVALVESELASILRELDLREFPHRIDLWLYDDVAELQRVTGVPSGGHSVPLASHVPHDNDQTRLHELVHVVAEKFAERGGPEPRNLFFAEGLANAVLRFVHGVHVDAVAAFHRQRGDLPNLAEIHRLPDFYSWLARHPHVNGYDVAGSWMRFLLDRHGAAKVRAYYGGAPVAATFGADLATLERAWHEHLDGVVLRPGTLALLRERHGRTAAERSPGEALLEPTVLGDAAAWRQFADRKLDGKPTHGDWCLQTVDPAPLGAAIVRATATPQDDCYGVRIDLGQDCQVLLLRGQGAFVYTSDGGIAHDATATLGGAVAIVLRRERGRANAWIDGRLVLTAEVKDAAAPFAIGCVGGPAAFTAIGTRSLVK